MRLLILLPLLIMALSAEDDCVQFAPSVFYCEQLTLRADEPLRANNSFQFVHLVHVGGSIGVKTLSLMPRLESLTVTSSNINSIENGAICSLPKLTGIDISGNEEFPTLTQSLFTNCDKIDQITLGNVTLEPTALHNFLNLRIIRFIKVHVEIFQTELLRPLSHLKELHIVCSDIKEIEPGSLCSSSNLEIMIIGNNEYLPHMSQETFKNCHTVKKFKFESNAAFDLEEETFSGFRNLEQATINHVRIVHLTKGHLEGLDNLEYLKLEHCNISTIGRYAFKGLAKLKRLLLGSNNLSEIHGYTFSHLTSLEEVVLYQNNIETIDNFWHPNLEILNVVENNISTIDLEAVKSKLPKLKYIYAGRKIMKIKFESLIVSFV